MGIEDDAADLVCEVTPGGLSDQTLRAQREHGI